MIPYCDNVYADTYFSERLHTEAWDCLGTTTEGIVTKTKALKHATSILERLQYIGSVAVPGQAYQFPRGTDTTIPLDVQNACAEIALSLLDGIDPEIEFKNLQESANQFASIKSTRDVSQTLEHIVAGVPSITAWRLIRPFLADNRSVTLTRVS